MRQILTRSVLAFAALLMLPFAVAHSQETSKLDEVLQRGKVIVGVTSESPPFGYIDESGELVGFDIDIARLVARSLFGGEENIEFVKQGFAARWANTQSGKIDFGIQVTTVYPDRLLKVAFTRPYIDSGIAIVVRDDLDIESPSDLNDSKYTVAHLTAPVQKDRGDRYYPEANTVTFDSVASQFTAVKTGRADAAQLDVPVAMFYAKDHNDVRVLDQWITDPTNNAIFLRHGDFKWWQVLDGLVAEMRGGSLFTEYSEIYQKWFGTKPRHAKYYVGAE
jgi:polar amino acid transport system substrate-binding protein